MPTFNFDEVINPISAYKNEKLQDEEQQFLTDEDFEATVDQNFTTVLSNGEEVELCAGG